jgi:hypothetical protein
MFDRMPGSLPQVAKRGGNDGQVVRSYPLALIIGWRSDSIDRDQD